ncbi:UNVERIFIED_CONTAM: cytochrome, partial [Sesamum radiatum]
NVFVAGTDTSAATITWAMTALTKKPQVLNKVQQEIRYLVGKKGSVVEDDIHKLPYFKAVVKETLRLYPPAPLSLPRLTIQASVVDGYEVEPDTRVYVNVWAIEVEVTLANLLYSFNWELPTGMMEDDVDMDSLPGLTTHKKNPLYLMAISYL